MGIIRTVLESTKAIVENITGGPDVVWIIPFRDVARMMTLPRFPAAVIYDTGGLLNPFNGKIWTRAFTVELIDSHPRDHLGEATTLALLDMGELLIDALEYSTNISVFSAGDSDEVIIGQDQGLLFLAKPYKFTVEFERA